jgi:hypothetical protein
MSYPSDTVLEVERVREVAAVFRSRDALYAAIDDLLLAGFDRADIDLVADPDAVQRRLGTAAVPAEGLADVPYTPRRPVVAPEEPTGVFAFAVTIVAFLGAAAAAFGVVAGGGSWRAAFAAAVGGGVVGATVGYVAARLLGARSFRETEPQLVGGGFILWVRVNSPEREKDAERVLCARGGKAVHPHEINLSKRVEDIPLSTVRPDPWLSDERLGRP